MTTTAYMGDELRALHDTLDLTDLGRSFMAKHTETFFGGDAPVAHDIIFGDYVAPATTHEHSTTNLRYVDRPTGHIAVRQLVLQQEWAIVTFDGRNRPIDRKTEWRDVPVVTE